MLRLLISDLDKLLMGHTWGIKYDCLRSSSGGTWRRPPSGTFTQEFEYCFIVACLMVVKVVAYIVSCVLCCVCVITFEHLFYNVSCCVTLFFKFLSCLSCFVFVAFVYVGAIFCEIGHGLGLNCFLLCTSVVV